MSNWRKGQFYYEKPSDADSYCCVVVDSKKSVQVTVAEEQAVDSGNSYFDCSISLPWEQAKKLRDMLNGLVQ